MATMFVSGKSVSSLGVAEDARLHKHRSVKALRDSGAVPQDEIVVLERFAALSEDASYYQDVLDLEKIAKVRADPARIKAFRADELVLLTRAVKRLEFAEPPRAEAFPPLPSLMGEVHDASTVPGAIDFGVRLPITKEHFDEADLPILERLQLVHDSDGKPATVTLSDLEAGAADNTAFTYEERNIFRRTKEAVEQRLRAEAPTPRATVVVPTPGVRPYLVPCTAPDVTVRLDTITSLTGDSNGRIEAKRSSSLHIELPPGTVAVLIQREPHKEHVVRASGPVHVPAGDYLVEVRRGDTQSAGHVIIPPSPDETVDLSAYAGYDFVNDDGAALWADIRSSYFASRTSHTVNWLAAAPDRVTNPGVALTDALGLSTFPLPPGLYRTEGSNLDLIVLNPHVAAVDLALDGTVHRIPLRRRREGFEGELPAPVTAAVETGGSHAEQYARERGVLATVSVGKNGWKDEVVASVDARGQRSTIYFAEKDRIA
jgi:hypothetical protein